MNGLHVRRKFLAVIALASLTLAAPACNSANDVAAVDQDDTISIELSQSALTLGIGNTVALQAMVRDGSGRSLSDRQLFWSTSDAAIARVSASGVVTAVSPGQAKIAATHGGRSAVANVVVAPHTVASVVLTPQEAGVLVGARVQLSARTLDRNGNELTGRVVQWSTSNSAIAVVDTTGAVTGIAAGFANVVATSEERTASVGVTVSPVPVATIDLTPALDTIVVAQTTQLTATTLDSTGAPLGTRPIVWSSSNTAVANVSSSGLVVGIAPGVAMIAATSENRTAESRIVVRPRPVSAVIVSPSQPIVVVGQSIALQVQITDENGTLLVDRPVQFQSANGAVAQVSANGTITGVAAGSTSITVTSESKSAQIQVTVTPVSVASVRVQPTPVDLIVGASANLAATAYDAAGNVLSSRPIAWTSGSPSVATVAVDGKVTAVSPGIAVIVATSEGKVGTATVNVRAVAVDTVIVVPAADTLIIGDAIDLAFEARDTFGKPLEGRVAFWTSDNESIAAVSSGGRVVALAVGVVQIHALVDGVIGSSTITAIVEPVLSITVDPTSVALHPTQTRQIVATPRGRNGIALTNRVVRFTTADATIATVSSTGLVTAVKVGTTSITVESEGKQVVVPVAITPVPVSSVSVSLASTTITSGQTTQATATARDSADTAIPGRAVTWATSNPLVATVSSAGVVTGLLPGTAVITATAEGKSGSATITVTIIPVASVTVTLDPASVTVGEKSQATATIKDLLGNTVTGREVTWSSSDATLATVDASGVVTTLGIGAVDIIATSEGKSGSATLTIANAPVASVTVTLTPATVIEGETSQGTATLHDANNNVLDGRVIIWTSSNTAVATVDAGGLVTTIRPGSAIITATSEGTSDSRALRVEAAAVARIEVTPETATVRDSGPMAGRRVQLAARAFDANNRELIGRSFSWSSNRTGIATVSANGLVIGRNEGVATITASSGGRSATATITVVD